MHAFDRQTDGRTDGQIDSYLIAIPRLHSMQRGKNERVSATVASFRDDGSRLQHVGTETANVREPYVRGR